MSSSVLLVGCGNIGSRLLQSVAAIDPQGDAGPVRVDVFEPSPQAREIAKARFAEVAGDGQHSLRFVDAVSEATRNPDLAIVATDARNRLAALQAAAGAGPKRALLEKFLFTKPEEYTAASRLLSDHGITAFVNTSRNVWSGYEQIKAELSGKKVSSMTVRGKDWNLGSNGIHFLALLEYLNDEPVEHIELSGDHRTRHAKRGGYRELEGQLVARTSGGARASLDSRSEIDEPISVLLEGQGWSRRIHEAAGRQLVTAGGESVEQPFEMNHASGLSEAFEDLILGRATGLPGFEQSARLHLLGMDAMNEAFHGARSSELECPVT